jgi:hypothetical protein
MQHPEHRAMDEQRDARQRLDALLPEDRVEHVSVIDPIQDDRLPLGGDAARETPADRNQDTLADLLLQAAGRRGDQLATRAVQQQHRGSIGVQDLPHPVQQRGEKIIGAQMGQCRIGNRPDVPQLVLRIWRRPQRQSHDERVTLTISRSASYCTIRARADGRRIEAVPPRLMPRLLPSRWTTPVPGGQRRTLGPAHAPPRTVLGRCAQSYGSERWGFESLRARPGHRPAARQAAGISCRLGATLGATHACQPPHSARLIDSAAAR